MSNLKTAKAAIQAELAHTKEGLAFYQSRIDALEKTLAQLASVSAGSSDATAVTIAAPANSAPNIATAKPAKSAKLVKPAKKTKGAKESVGGNQLPFTGGDYWTNLVTDQPRSASDILEASVGSLGFTPTKAQIQKLAGRLTFAINALVKTKKIKDSGSGRERRFFKA
jgi:Tfp pilus assembly protein FimV